MTLLLGLLLALAGGERGGRVPTYEQLAAARKKGDTIELERVARQLGAARLTGALASDHKRVRAAAVAAAPRVDEAWTLIEPLARLVAEDDPDVGREAADAAAVIADGISPAAGDEIPTDALRRAAQALSRAAASRDRDVELRVAALGAVASLALRLPVESLPEVTALLVDPEVRVRRAAIEAYGAVLNLQGATRLAALVKKEPLPDVAAVGGAALCRAADQIAGAQALVLEVAPRVRTLTRDAATPPEDLLELARCLAIAGSAVDRQLLGELAARHADAQVRREARALLDSPPRVPPLPAGGLGAPRPTRK